MRIAFIAPFGLQPKGTVSARMLPLAEALAERGHRVRVVIPPWDDPSAKPGTISPAQGGVELVTLPLSNHLPNSLTLTYGLVKRALSPWRETADGSPHSARPRAQRGAQLRRTQVVHVFKPLGYSGIAPFALQPLRVPWVLDTDDWEGPGGWADVNPYSRAQKLTVTITEAILPRLAGAVTAASRTLEARAWNFGLPRSRVFYMPNGIWEAKYSAWLDVPIGHKDAPTEREKPPTVLLYTRFAEFPFWWPLDVLKLVLRDHPTAQLLVVGSGFFGGERKLQAEARRSGLQEHMTILGRVPEAELATQLSRADVAIYPMADNLINRAKSPMKVLEPMLLGLPVVAHRVGQAAEFIGDAGVLVSPADLQGMGEAVSALLSNPSRREELSHRARNRTLTEFNWRKLCLQAEQAYRCVLPTS